MFMVLTRVTLLLVNPRPKTPIPLTVCEIQCTNCTGIPPDVLCNILCKHKTEWVLKQIQQN